MFSIKYDDMTFDNKVIVRPLYMSICHADQRYYTGKREGHILKKKLPMALIHECCGEVIYDGTGQYKPGQNVVIIPNVPGQNDSEIYENYSSGCAFLSSGYDGFMREYISIEPNRVVGFKDIPLNIACIAEFVSVGVHAVSRFKKMSHCHKDTIGIWGDGSLAFIVANILKKEFPKSKICVIGRNLDKLSLFSFAYKTMLVDSIDKGFKIDHAFECAGGEGSYYAIEDIIKYINPQGSVMLMGVSENKVPINTRNILEKGLTFIGCSRSGREEFQKSIEYLEDKSFQRRVRVIINEDKPVTNIEDIHRVFANDLTTPFKTVFQWKI